MNLGLGPVYEQDLARCVDPLHVFRPFELGRLSETCTAGDSNDAERGSGLGLYL